MRAKVAKSTPSTSKHETSCAYDVGADRVILSYYTNPNDGPKARGFKEDPFMKGLSLGPKVQDFGNIGCKITDAGVLYSTGCNRYQPRWLHIAVQTHGKTPVAIDTARLLLEKAGSRFK